VWNVLEEDAGCFPFPRTDASQALRRQSRRPVVLSNVWVLPSSMAFPNVRAPYGMIPSNAIVRHGTPRRPVGTWGRTRLPVRAPTGDLPVEVFEEARVLLARPGSNDTLC
jgi:hypothetical protein